MQEQEYEKFKEVTLDTLKPFTLGVTCLAFFILGKTMEQQHYFVQRMVILIIMSQASNYIYTWSLTF